MRLTGEWSSNSSQAQIGHSWTLFVKQFLSSDTSFASFWDFSFSLENSFFNLVLWSFIFSIFASFLAFALSALIWILPHSSVFVLRSFSNFSIWARYDFALVWRFSILRDKRRFVFSSSFERPLFLSRRTCNRGSKFRWTSDSHFRLSSKLNIPISKNWCLNIVFHYRYASDVQS